MLNRRQVLKRIATLVGSALSSSTLAAALSARRPAGGVSDGEWQPLVLKDDLDELVATLAELIIPRTDTRGARDAKVHEFIDLMLAEWMQPAERLSFLTGLADVDERARKAHRASFVDCSEAQQTVILEKLEEEAQKELATAAKKAEKEERKAKKRAEKGKETRPATGMPSPRPFFSHLKELTLVGYYTSEIGATEELNHVIVFDEYEGCVPLDEVGAAWSS